MSGQEPVRRHRRARNSKHMLEIDLNAPCESRDHEGTSNSQARQTAQEGNAAVPPAIDVDAFDDDVIISSPRAFAEAKKKSRTDRGCPVVIVDVESEERTSRNKRKRVTTNQTIINCDLFINLEGNSSSMRMGGQSVAPPPPPPPPPPPKEPTFSCPVCMGPLVEEMSTKCGHIFCKKCIKAAIAAQSKCPTCRRKTTAKDILRIYLPATGSA